MKDDIEFTSEAKLLIRGVGEGLRAEPGGKAPDAVAMLRAEVAMLESSELLQRVAKAIEPGKLLGPDELGDEAYAKAAAVIQKGLHVTSKGTNLILLRFQHADPAIAQQVLVQILDIRFEQLLTTQKGNLEGPNDSGKRRNLHLTVIQVPTTPASIEVAR